MLVNLLGYGITHALVDAVCAATTILGGFFFVGSFHNAGRNWLRPA